MRCGKTARRNGLEAISSRVVRFRQSDDHAEPYVPLVHTGVVLQCFGCQSVREAVRIRCLDEKNLLRDVSYRAIRCARSALNRLLPKDPYNS